MPDGLDIAKWQAGIPISRLKAEGIYFVIHKASGANGGSLYVDSKYHEHVPKIRAEGIRIGHYFFNGPVDATASANYFVDNLSGYQPEDVLALDIEGEGLQGVEWSRQWFAQVKARIPNAKLFLYTTQSIVRQWDWSPVVAQGVRLWIAAPGDDNPYVGEFGDWAIHQYTWTASIAGFGPLDGNHSRDNVWTAADDGYGSSERKEVVGRMDEIIIPALKNLQEFLGKSVGNNELATDLKSAFRREFRYRLYTRTSDKKIAAVNWKTGNVRLYDNTADLQWDVDNQIVALFIDAKGTRPENPLEKSDEEFQKVLDTASKLHGYLAV